MSTDRGQDDQIAKRACADFHLDELLRDPGFYKVAGMFLFAVVFIIAMYGPAWLWAKWTGRI
jgi:hypothetical protein